MTDSLYGAAQYGCQWSLNYPLRNGGPERIISVAELRWRGTGLKVKEFEDDAEYEKFLTRATYAEDIDPAIAKVMTDNDMISSPINIDFVDTHITDHFRQYAVLKQRVVDEGKLIFQGNYTIDCSMVELNQISEQQYTDGQKTDATVANGRFGALVRMFTTQSKKGVDLWDKLAHDICGVPQTAAVVPTQW